MIPVIVRLIKKTKIYNFTLPTKIAGNYWITDNDYLGNTRNLINVEEENGKWKKDDLVLDKNGKPQYKCCFFSLTQKEDENLCTENPEDFYASPEIQSEMNLGATIVVGQTI